MSLPLTTMADPTTVTPDAATCNRATCNDPSYLLSDHLGSTSITTDVEGNLVSETRYNPWGEVRHASGLTPTDYTYTDQYSYMDDPTTSASEGFGLMFYNARWYDPGLGRFTQADSIVPLASQGTQAWDRYAYTNNNPLRYTDPSGHALACIDGEFCGEYRTGNAVLVSRLHRFGIETHGLSYKQRLELAKAANYFGTVFYQTYGAEYGFTSSEDAFKQVASGNIIISSSSRNDCETTGFNIECGANVMTTKAFVHEFFHVMDNNYRNKTTQQCSGEPCWASSNLPYEYYTDPGYTIDAYKCNSLKCVSHPAAIGGMDACEAFANAGESLVLETLGVDLVNNGFALNKYGEEVKGWMEKWMPYFLNVIQGVK